MLKKRIRMKNERQNGRKGGNGKGRMRQEKKRIVKKDNKKEE